MFRKLGAGSFAFVFLDRMRNNVEGPLLVFLTFAPQFQTVVFEKNCLITTLPIVYETFHQNFLFFCKISRSENCRLRHTTAAINCGNHKDRSRESLMAVECLKEFWRSGLSQRLQGTQSHRIERWDQAAEESHEQGQQHAHCNGTRVNSQSQDNEFSASPWAAGHNTVCCESIAKRAQGTANRPTD